MRKRPGRMLLGLLLPVLAGFVIAKTGFGPRSTSHAMGNFSHRLHLPKSKTGTRTGEDHAAAEETKDSDIPRIAETAPPPVKEEKLPPVKRKFLGIV